MTDRHSLREAKKKFSINYQTLSRYLKAKQAKQNFAVGNGMLGKILPANLAENSTEYAKKLTKYFMALFRFTITVISTCGCKQCESARVLDN